MQQEKEPVQDANGQLLAAAGQAQDDPHGDQTHAKGGRPIDDHHPLTDKRQLHANKCQLLNDDHYPLVSVITPTYNKQPFIGSTIESVQAQTYPNWEMIIVDDGSTDQTVPLIAAYAEEDARLRLIKLEDNSRAAIARNTAMDQAEGRYVAFLDADDQWMPDKLEKQLQFMQEGQIGFSFTKYMKIKEDGTETKASVDIPDRVHYNQLLKHNVIGCLTVMLDTHITGKVSMPDIRSRQDFALWLSLCKRGFTAYGFQEVLAKCRVVEHSLSSNKWKMAKQNWKIYRDIEKLSLPKSIWYFMNYVYLSTKKYLV